MTYGSIYLRTLTDSNFEMKILEMSGHVDTSFDLAFYICWLWYMPRFMLHVFFQAFDRVIFVAFLILCHIEFFLLGMFESICRIFILHYICPSSGQNIFHGHALILYQLLVQISRHGACRGVIYGMDTFFLVELCYIATQ